ncbi:adenosylmethionine decarboxylase [bacterium endosymbiont of Pedicinus badii]|uniref:adenosylmethionine decarboxylase n=1 Tax=bacterium endosymbiont of Pedicinus badii TaxID=1719126 RepID=UPI0009B9D6EE|nr:adenosylmethionine decarboxylase [bacterium endosymbiont of Pedicinus badii]OQM34232.1 S-adenosylmethionine decarboxylase proenzyme [bacterium endosymbiont of Pedicinus badii]
MRKFELYGFNNLTKSLSFYIYELRYTNSFKKNNYISYINEKYNSKKLTKILQKICSIIGANVLNISRKDYSPQGASVAILVGEKNSTKNLNNNHKNKSIVAHLNTSHICVHTYPENNKNGICVFRADIEVSTCGIISPLKALGYLIYKLKSDIIMIDYKIRGFTRDKYGVKHYSDQKFHAVSDFIPNKIKNVYHIIDTNIFQEKFFRTKMILRKFNLKRYLLNTSYKKLDKKDKEKITKILCKEMQEIFYGNNIFK